MALSINIVPGDYGSPSKGADRSAPHHYPLHHSNYTPQYPQGTPYPQVPHPVCPLQGHGVGGTPPCRGGARSCTPPL